MKSTLAAALLAIAPILYAATTDMTIAGFTLGAPLTIPQCDDQPHSMSVPTNMPCYRNQSRYLRSSDLGTPGWKVVTIMIGFGPRPAILNGSQIEAFIRDDTLVAVKFSTNGSQSQSSDLQTLIEKYGKPTSRKVERFQNGFGAKFEGVVAVWRLRDLLVQFESIFPDLETGLVAVALPEGIELINADVKRLSGNKSKL